MELFIGKDRLLKAATDVGMVVENVEDNDTYYVFSYIRPNADKNEWSRKLMVCVFGDHIRLIVYGDTLEYMGNIISDFVTNLRVSEYYDVEAHFYGASVEVSYYRKYE